MLPRLTLLTLPLVMVYPLFRGQPAARAARVGAAPPGLTLSVSLPRHLYARNALVRVTVRGQWISLARPTGSQTMRPSVRIAYVHGGNIWVLDEPGGRRTRLTGDGHDFAPYWTANGETLFFCRGAGGGCATWRWQPGKGHPQAGTRRVQDGLWSPDGRAVAVTRIVRRAGSPTTVWIARQGRMIRITPLQPRYRWFPLAWSPDSRRLALGRVGIPPPTNPGQEIPSTPGSLWLTTGAMGSPRLQRLPLLGSYLRQPGWPDGAFWSPDGRFLTVAVGPDFPCSSCHADGHPYYVIPGGGGKVVSLGTALDPGAISWAPDGSYVVLSAPGGRETYLDKHLVRVDPATGLRHALTGSRKWADIEPEVSPDGKLIAFARGRSSGASTRVTPVELIASRHVLVMEANGAALHQVTGAPGWTDEAPIWSPNGRWLLFVRWRRQGQNKPAEATLWAVRADGRGSQRLARLDLPDGFLSGFGYYGTFDWQQLFAMAP